ncbi:MAG TPA: lipopolysaccharide heptosyltransferase II [Candidatus Omnitrophota bacterium]|nr:lipopolysaccharide heptosyltransferase II [Candidatus Omnitrophota bacterium]
MNILQILPELNVGGVETGTVDFAKYLVAHGHKSVVISAGGQMVDDLESSGSKHYKIAVHQKSLWRMLKAIKDVRRVIKDENIDIVHARSRVPAWIAYFACRKTKAAFITTCHGYYKNRLFSQIMGWGKFVIVPSQVIGRHMIDDYKVSSHSIRCIPRSVDCSKFVVSDRKSVGPKGTIAIIGRLTPLKGHTYFLKSMTKIVRQIPYAKIWIIGDAPKNKRAYKQELEVLVKRLGLSNHVEFLGNRKDIPELLSQIDVLVLSTVTEESFGRVIIEGQAAGVAVVATKVGGVVDVIEHEKTGLLVMPKDTDGMANAVLKLLRDKNLYDRLVVEAKKKVQECYTLENMASKTLAVYEELLNSLNILVVKIRSIGDVILVVPSLKVIRQNFPRAKIYCLVGEESKKILQHCPYIDGLIIFNTKNRNWFYLLELSRKLRKYRFDKIFDFQNSRRSHLLSCLTFARESYGYDNKKWGNLLTNPIKKYRNDMAAVLHQFQLLEKSGLTGLEKPFLELWPSEKDNEYAKNILESEWLGNFNNIVGINIAASLKWQTKNWPLESIARLCDMLAGKNIRVVLTGADKDRQQAQYILSLCKSKPANLVAKTDIMQLAAVIKRCKCFITPDSAPMHVASAMQVPLVALFGPTDPNRHVPPAKKIVIIAKELECAPCYNRRCKIFTHACMKSITPEQVFKEILKLMEIKS